MKANSKKCLSLLAALAMILALIPVLMLPAAATTQDDISAWIVQNDAAFKAGTNLPDTCPFCGETKVVWNALESATGGVAEVKEAYHGYLPVGGVTMTGGGSALQTHAVSGKNTTYCLYLNGQSMTFDSRVRIRARAILNIFGDGTMTRTQAKTGESMFAFSDSATLNIYGGTLINEDDDVPMIENLQFQKINVYGGKLTSRSILEMKEGSMAVLGGEVNGDITLIGPVAGRAISLKLSGTPIISGTNGVSLRDGIVANIEGLESGASIKVSGKIGDVLTGVYENASQVADCFNPGDGQKVQAQEDNTLKIVEGERVADVSDRETAGGPAALWWLWVLLAAVVSGGAGFFLGKKMK